jgi:membrane protein implicated in regulation of membrane protease activity
MWVLGLVLLVLGLLVHSGILFWIGVILLVVGLALYFAPARHDSRRWYW